MAACDGIHIVLAGRGGCGKSATANTLCGGNYFKSKCSTFPVTKCFERKIVLNAADHTQLIIVDSPALFDIYDDENIVSKELALCLDLAYSKIDILLVVVPLNERFTSKDKEVFDQIESVLGNCIRKNIVVCFSYEDELNKLNKENFNMNSYLESSPTVLVDLIKRYDNRYLTIDNTQNSDQQRQNMIGIFMKLMREFEYCSYTMKNMIEWKEQLQKRKKKFEDDERSIDKKYEPIIDYLKKEEKKQRKTAIQEKKQFPNSKFDGYKYKGM
ncbi:Hypothetical predicted protein [Mytilus galloprovincialis]|uniref:AIG1-type G domain-containing protein n=1 Tax=Mytilus galloprovincialis TaxID=29158 RepID=A0A8B6CT85_MYTGA|nr:Hypothetical predicted protein [Mytilus galloprovincialis]